MTSKQTDPNRPDAQDPFALPLDELIAAVTDDSDGAPVQYVRPATDSHRGKFEKGIRERKPAPGRAPQPPEAGAEEEPLPEPRKPWPRAVRWALFACLVLATLGSLFVIGVDRYVHYHAERGRAQLVLSPDNVSLTIPEDNKRVAAAEDGKTVKYQGHTYRLNENLATVLFMGIDRKSIDGTEEYGNGGQADSILLIAIDVETGESKVINISRDSYVEMMIYSGSGQELGLQRRQLCLAYAYGDGRETSCENMVETVSRLLYGMPVQKYIALDMDGVLEANEALGGITVTSLNNILMPDGSYVQEGEEITLHGKNCERYIRTRDNTIDANDARMARQKQYVQAFAKSLTQKAKSDFGFISSLYERLSPYMVSNLDLSDVIFLARTYLDYRMDLQFLSIAGTFDWLEHGDDRNAVYYLDEDSLFETVLEVFYQQVD